MRTTGAQLTQRFSKKVIVGFAAIASAAVLTTIGMAGAAPDKNPHAQNNSGYGGNSNVSSNVDVDADATVVGDNNMVQFVVNIYNTINIFS